ncbi:MAG: sugar porter family MFS transporter [Thermoguttaceae bacterium]|jgi:SP family arabinose:H+ symporter-like MFS transporter|nr:sugar porter family MFS transporter [Thermoguttaceae bacterium]
MIEAEHALTSPPASGRGSVWYLTLVCLVAALSGVLFGFDTGVISGAIGMLRERFQLSEFLEGVTVTAVLIGCLVGVAIAGTLSDRFGRKITLLLSAALFVFLALAAAMTPRAASWYTDVTNGLLLWLFGERAAPEIAGLINARFLGGMGIGVASMLAPLYIAEISPPQVRGRLIALYQFAITVGILVTYLSNDLLLRFSQSAAAWLGQGFFRAMFVDEVWRGMFLVGVLPAIVFLLLLLLVPESPRWLTKQGHDKQAEAILARVAGPDQAAREMAEIRETIAHESGSILQLFHSGMRLRLLIGVLLPFFSQIIGINAIIYYGPRIFEVAGYDRTGALGTQVLFGVVNTVFTTIAVWKVDKLGRRPLLLAGIAGTGIAIALCGLLFHLGMERGPLLPLLCVFYLACFSVSYGPVCWIIVSEIFPTRIRGRAMSISIFSLWTGCILVSLTVPWLLAHIGPAVTFWLYALTGPVAFVFTYGLVPETKGRTLEQIEARWVH